MAQSRRRSSGCCSRFFLRCYSTSGPNWINESSSGYMVCGNCNSGAQTSYGNGWYYTCRFFGTLEEHSDTNDPKQMIEEWELMGTLRGCKTSEELGALAEKHPRTKMPQWQETCICLHPIVHNCVIRHKRTNEVLIVGKCCIKKWKKETDKNLSKSCKDCGAPIRRTKSDICEKCEKLRKRSARDAYGPGTRRRLIEHGVNPELAPPDIDERTHFRSYYESIELHVARPGHLGGIRLVGTREKLRDSSVRRKPSDSARLSTSRAFSLRREALELA